MVEGEKDIQVRTISGDATTIRVSAKSTIEDLKLLLKRSFPPATHSPSFHLFFKGVKLKLEGYVDVQNIGNGEFIVLVPFTKKNSNQTKKSDQSNTPLNVPKDKSILKLADLAWSDMMQDLSCLSHTSCSGASSDSNIAGVASSSSFDSKRKRGIYSDDVILDILRCSKSTTHLDEQNCERFGKVLELVNCLRDPHSGSCMLSRISNRMALQANSGSSCFCPEWLKVMLKTFTFLNIISTFIQLQQERTTLELLEKAVAQLGCFGIKLVTKDLEHLSVLCPKIVFFSENVYEQNTSVDSLVIISCSTKENCQVKNCEYVPRRMALLDAFCALKRRENTFKMSLWESIEQFALVTEKKKFASFSLEDMLFLAKDMSTAASGNQVKEARRCHGTSSSHSNPKQCQVTDILSPLDMIEHLRNGTGSSGQIVHVEDIGVRKAIHVEILNILSKNIICALKRIGVTKLYSHQAESTRASLDGKHVVVATMTSSGKSLCYNLPTLEVLSQNMMSCALYLFPTKALAQDQLRALLLMTKQFDVSLNVGVYDGDTSQGDRAWLRDNARLLITNPDMLHLSILPYHKQFARILSNLRFVVVDESHVYKGAFGCHTALILRRLRRLCSYVYGSEPSFIFSTATSANPREHCMELANLQQVELIQNDGSPSARKLFILWNPLSHQETVLRRTHGHTDDSKSGHDDYKTKSSSPILHVSLLFAEMVQHGLRCIAFCKTRKLCELVLCYTREILQETASHLVDSICAYRAGYMAEDRRSIERDFFGGKLCGVAATNALELGVDVGHIDVTLHLGFPGSIASLWQQAGRAGRRIKPSLAVYVAFEGPLDQYFMKYPRKLFDSPIECCHIDSQNQQVLEQHLVCAALEHPLNLVEDEKYFGCGLEGSVMALKGRGNLSSDPSTDFNAKVWNYIGHEKVPSRSVSIRAIETEKYQVMDKRSNEVLEEIEESKAFFQVYEGAVYMRQGKTYLVGSLDLSSKIALCEEADLKYYTKSRDCTDIHVMGGDMLRGTMARSDPCKVTTSWFGFHRLWKGSSKIFETVDHSLPTYSYMSQAVWVPVPQSTKAAVKMKNLDFRAGLHAASHAVLNVVPLRIICNLSDLAPECANPHDTRYFPERILLYDQHPGGIGLSLQVRSFFMGLLTAALELLTSCHCLGDSGCPNCVQSFACKEYNEVLHKDAAIMILKGVLDAEESYR